MLGSDTPLIASIESRDLFEIKRLIRSKVDVNIPMENGNTALLYSVDIHSVPIATELIRAKADVNQSDSSGWTALLVSSGYGDIDLTRLLLDSKADTEITNQCETPLMIAIQDSSCSELTHLLIESKANVNRPSPFLGRSPLHMAARRGRHDIVDMLLEAKADINTKNDYEERPMLTALKWGHIRCAEILSKHEMEIKRLEYIRFIYLGFSVITNSNVFEDNDTTFCRLLFNVSNGFRNIRMLISSFI